MSARPIVLRRSRAMGCAVEAQIALDDPACAPQAEAALTAALDWIAQAEGRLSRFQPASELCALNRSAGTPFHASEDLFAIVSTALAWRDRTGGLFDPTLLAEIERWGYDRDFGEIGIGVRCIAPHASEDRHLILLDPATRAITLPPSVGIDLGGIGKGWAADMVLERVLGNFPHALVNIGGDLALRGGPDDTGWIVGVRDPRRESEAEPVYLGGVRLRKGGVATSGAAWRWWRINGQTAHHLIDPRTGRPATTVGIDPAAGLPLAATALAATATEAEVRAKEALLLGLADGLARLDGGTERAGWFILGDGRIVPSANLQAYLMAGQTHT